MFIFRILIIITTTFFITVAFAEENLSKTTTLVSPSATMIKTNINQAAAQELLKIKGLNASKVRAIISFRKKHGNFKSLDQLSEVKGMKRLKPLDLKTIQDQLAL